MGYLEQLLEMGFGENQSQRALSKTNHKGVEAAMEWILNHSEDPDINDPFDVPQGKSLGDKTETTTVTESPQSLKCDDCGKLLSTPDKAQLHASRTGHSNFSESTDVIKPLTEEEKAQQLILLKEKIKQRKEVKEVQDIQDRKANEKIRRSQGRDMSSAKQKFQDMELMKIAEEKKRDKLAEKMAKERVREAIARDKANRIAKNKSSGSIEVKQEVSMPVVTPQPSASVTEKKEYTETRIQVRLTSGKALSQTFGINDTLSAVRLYVNQESGEYDTPITFMTTFPRKVYEEGDMQRSLAQLDLVPSAVLMIKKA